MLKPMLLLAAVLLVGCLANEFEDYQKARGCANARVQYFLLRNKPDMKDAAELLRKSINENCLQFGGAIEPEDTTSFADDEVEYNVFTEILKGKLDEIIGKLTEAIKESAGHAKQVLEQLLVQARDLIQKLQQGGKGVITAVKEFLINAIKALHETGRATTDDQELLLSLTAESYDIESRDFISTILKSYLDKIIGHLQEALQQSAGHAKEVLEKLLAQGSELMKQLQQGAKGIVTAVKDFIVAAIRALHETAPTANFGDAELLAFSEQKCEQFRRLVEQFKDIPHFKQLVEKLQALIDNHCKKPELYNSGLPQRCNIYKQLVEALKSKPGFSDIVQKLETLIANHCGSNEQGLFLSESDDEMLERNIISAILGEKLNEIIAKLTEGIKESAGHVQEVYVKLLAQANALLQQLHQGAKGIVTAVKDFIIAAIRALHETQYAENFVDFETFAYTPEQCSVFRRILESLQGKPQYDRLREKLQNIVDLHCKEGTEYGIVDSILIDLLKAKLDDVIRHLQEAIQTTAGHIKDVYVNLLQQAAKLMKDLQTQGKGVVTAVKEFLVNAIRALHEKEQYESGLLSVDESAEYNVFTEILKGKLDEIIGKLTEAIKESAGHAKQVLEQLLVQARDLIQKLQQGGKGVITAVKEFLINAIKALHETGRATTDDQELLLSLTAESYDIESRDFISTILKSYLDKIIGHLQEALQQSAGHAKEVLEKLLAQGSELMKQLQQGAKGIVTAVKDFIVAAIRALHETAPTRNFSGERSLPTKEQALELLKKLKQELIEHVKKLLEEKHLNLEKVKEILGKLVPKEDVQLYNELAVDDIEARNILKDIIMKKLEDVLDQIQAAIQETAGQVHNQLVQILEEGSKLLKELHSNAKNVVTIAKNFIITALRLLQGIPHNGQSSDLIKAFSLIDNAQQDTVIVVNGKKLTPEEVKALLEKVKKLIGDRLREFLEKHQINPDKVKEILDKLLPAKDSESYVLTELEGRNVIAVILGQKLDEIIQKLQEAIQSTAGHVHEVYVKLLAQANKLVTELHQGAKGVVTAIKDFIVAAIRALHETTYAADDSDEIVELFHLIQNADYDEGMLAKILKNRA